MKMMNSNTSATRRGATLTEVLMSLLVMGVGITSVLSLFPLSIVSSIKATQLTNAKTFAQNTEEMFRSRPELVLGGKVWEPSTVYTNAGPTPDRVFPSSMIGNLTPTNLIHFTANGTSGNLEPIWPTRTPATTTDGTLTWTAVVGDQRFVVDPLGAFFQDSTLNPTEFGTVNLASDPGHMTRITAEQLGLVDGSNNADLNRINEFFAIPDGWTVAVDDQVPSAVSSAGTMTTGSTTFSIDPKTMPAMFSPLVMNDPRFWRVVATSVDGTETASSTVNEMGSTNVITDHRLPAHLDSTAEIGSVRIELLERKFTSLITVNRSSTGKTVAECAVVFNRGYRQEDEELYPYTIPAVGAGDTLNVTWAANAVAPTIHSKNYCLDVRTGRWHQVTDVQMNANDATVLLSPPLFGNNITTATTGDIVFMPGVVDVFEIEL